MLFFVRFSFLCSKLFFFVFFLPQLQFISQSDHYFDIAGAHSVVDESPDNAARVCPKIVVGPRGAQQSLTTVMTYVVVNKNTGNLKQKHLICFLPQHQRQRKKFSFFQSVTKSVTH